MISYDVVSLFTNIPIIDAINVIHERLSNDEALIERTKLTADDVKELLIHICINFSFLRYEK